MFCKDRRSGASTQGNLSSNLQGSFSEESDRNMQCTRGSPRAHCASRSDWGGWRRQAACTARGSPPCARSALCLPSLSRARPPTCKQSAQHAQHDIQGHLPHTLRHIRFHASASATYPHHFRHPSLKDESRPESPHVCCLEIRLQFTISRGRGAAITILMITPISPP